MTGLSLSEKPAFIQWPSNAVAILLTAQVYSHLPYKLAVSSERDIENAPRVCGIRKAILCDLILTRVIDEDSEHVRLTADE